MGSMAVRWLLLILTGCSLTLSGPDPNRPRTKPPVCDTSKSLVALDGVMAATMAIVGVAAASSNNGSEAVAPALLAAAFIGSAIHGNNLVNDCHREMDGYDQMMAARDIEAASPPAVAAAPMAAPPMAAPPMAAPPMATPPPMPQPEPAAPDEQQGAPEPPAPPAATPAAPPSRDRWSAFWREVP